MSDRDPGQPDDAGDFEVVRLAGGSSAIRERSSGEVMHPSVGPWREANELYVAQSGLTDKLALSGPPLVLYDVGLGAAANLAAALHAARALGPARRRALHVESFERDLTPLRLALSHPAEFFHLQPFRAELLALVEAARFEAPGLSLRLRLGDAREGYAQAEAPADVVFFDPFSPASSSALWTPRALAALRARCKGALDDTTDGATLYTYSAATPTRVSLLLAGFFVGVGAPIGTKVETTAAATRLGGLSQPLDARWLDRWRRSSARAPHGAPEEWLGADEVGLEARLLAHPQLAIAGR